MRRRLFAVAAAACVSVAACTAPASPPETGEDQHDGRDVVENRAVPDERWAELEDDFDDLVDEVAQEHGGVAGIVVTDGARSAAAGAEGTHSVWSTIKVPIAIAATRNGTGDEDLIDLAITESDNDASWMLWNSLGDTRDAALQVEQVMLDGGGPGDVYDAVTNLAGSPTGNAEWALAEQAKFATNLKCLDGADETYEAMGEIVEWQRDGLGTIDGARFKGGWSEEYVEGTPITYTYRQFGVIETADGNVGVAILAYPEDGTHETAGEMLDALAEHVDTLLDDDKIPLGPACRFGKEV